MKLLAADVILHPVRMRIISTLMNRRLTTQQIHAALPDISQATLYRHLSRLMKAEVIEVVERRPVRGVVEKVYATADQGVPMQFDYTEMTRSDWQSGFAAFTASLLGQFEAYIQQEQANPINDGVSFRSSALNLTDDELKQMSLDLRAVLEPLTQRPASPGRRRRLFSAVLIPDIDIGDTDFAPDVADTGESL